MANTVQTAENNMAAIEELTSKRTRTIIKEEEVYQFIDAAGKLIIVCPKSNKVGWIDKVNKVINWYSNGMNAKMNGYSYANITLEKCDGEITYGQHVIIGMCDDNMRKEYNRIKAEGNTPELCHKRGCPWDNGPMNTEWGTGSNNRKHAKITRSLKYNFGDKYVEMVTNLGKYEFMVLKQPLLNKYIVEYMKEKGSKVFSTQRNESYLSESTCEAFVNWMYARDYWELPVHKAEIIIDFSCFKKNNK